MRRLSAAFLISMLAWPAAWAESGPELGSDMTNPGYVPHPEWFKQSFLDLNEDIEEAFAEGRHLMLYFYQDGCPYCKMFIENDLGQYDIAEYAQQNFDIVAINIFGALEVTDVDGEALAESKYAMKTKVMFTPTLLVYGEDGSVVFRMNGYYPPPRFRAVMRFIAERRYADERFVEYYGSQEKQAEGGVLHVSDSTLPGPPFDLTKRDPDKPLLVMFEQKECLGCDELHQDIFRRPETRDVLEKFEIAVLGIREKAPLTTPSGKETNSLNWAMHLGVKVVPTQVMFDSEGKEVFRNEGYVKAFHVQSILDYVASGAYLEYDEFQRYIQVRAEHLQEKGAAVNLME